MCILLGMSKQLIYAFPGLYNKETISSNNNYIHKGIFVQKNCHFIPFLDLKKMLSIANSFGFVHIYHLSFLHIGNEIEAYKVSLYDN